MLIRSRYSGLPAISVIYSEGDTTTLECSHSKGASNHQRLLCTAPVKAVALPAVWVYRAAGYLLHARMYVRRSLCFTHVHHLRFAKGSIL